MSGLAVYFRHRSSALLLLVWPVLVWASTPRATSRRDVALGAAVVGAGVALRLAAVRLLGRRARVYRAGARDGLVSSGPFAYTRNPLYLSAGIVLVGLSLVAGAGWPALWLLPAAIGIYTPVVRHEERMVALAAGPEFAAYAQSVPRWLGFRRASGGAGSAPVPWREVLRNEPMLVPGLAVAVAALAWVRTGGFPLAELLGSAEQALGVPRALLWAGTLLVAAAVNSTLVERKHRLRAERRALILAAGSLPERA